MNRRSHHVCPSLISEVMTRFQLELGVAEPILIFFFGVMFLGSRLSILEPSTLICHRHFIRCSTRQLSTRVRTMSFVIRPCAMQFETRLCVLQNVTVQVRRTSALTVQTLSSPGFSAWNMPSDAWVETTELSQEKKKARSPTEVSGELPQPTPGTVIVQDKQSDTEIESSEQKEGTASEMEVKGSTAPEGETRKVVLVTMEPEGTTEVIVKPQEPTEKAKEPEALPEPEIPEQPFETAKSPEKVKEGPTDQEKDPEEAAEQEKTTSFKMKSWSAWLRRQDDKGRSPESQESGTSETSSETTPRRESRREATGHLQRSVYQKSIHQEDQFERC